MQTEYLIAVDEFCTNNKVENSFISLLEQNGLIEITTIQDAGFIDAGQIQQIEKYVHFYYELDINLEGIEAITHLLRRIDAMHDEIVTLRNRLRLYETEL
jgi:chaperone modulatory protein CbpM